MLDKIKGALYGVAIGDALGAPLEFMTAAQIKQKHGVVTEMIGGGWLDVAPGEVTDDTQMTVAVAAGIVESPLNPVTSIGHRFIAWVNSNPKDIGATCAAAIRMAAAQKKTSLNQWLDVSRQVAKSNGQRSGGNGALMRTVYPGLYYNEEKEAIEKTLSIASMTHWDELSNSTCSLYTKMIFHLVRGANKQEVIAALKNTEYKNYAQEDLNPTGWVYDSMICALRCTLETDSFEAAIVRCRQATRFFLE